jgi:hypothetical protein
MPTFPEALFNVEQTSVATDETLTTEPTWVPVGPAGEPIGGIPPSLLDSEGRLPAGILKRERHTVICAFRKPTANEEPIAIFEFENGCLLYVLTRVCYRTTQYFFVHGTVEYRIGSSMALVGETQMAVRICPDRFDVMGEYPGLVGDPTRPTPLGSTPDDYVWIPPNTFPPRVDHAHFVPGPATGVDGIHIWHDVYLWHIAPPTQRRRCKIFTRYRLARIRRVYTRDGTPVGRPATIFLEPPIYFDLIHDIPGCR